MKTQTRTIPKKLEVIRCLGKEMIGSSRFGYALDVWGLRCVVWLEDGRWCGSICFNNRTIKDVTNNCAEKQQAADKIEDWLVSFANDILKKHNNKDDQ